MTSAPLHVLVTGGAGYLGSILIGHLLEHGYAVTVLDNLLYRQESLLAYCAHPHFNFVYGDCRDAATLQECLKTADVIIPLAAIVGFPACARDPLSATSINYDAIRLLDSLRSCAQMMIYPTTNSGYGTTTGELHCTEETPLNPISVYGKTKVDAEAHLLDGGNAITLRLATVFGMSPRMRLDLLVNDFTWQAATHGSIIIFQKDFKRNYVHIRDVAACFAFCIENYDALKSEPYNVGLNDANLSKEELARLIQKYVTKFYIHFAEIGSDPDKRNYIVSNDKINARGFHARYTLDDGIQELLKGYRILSRRPHTNL